MLGIYSIRNLINGKIYIGQAKDIEYRWVQHKTNLKKNKHINKYLQNSWNKYGEDNFIFSVIEELHNEEYLNQRERYYIEKFQSNNLEFGYNLTNGGEGYSLNEDVKNRISINRRGKKTTLSEEQVVQIKMALYCLMDRKEIGNLFDISTKVITQIAIGSSFSYVCEELNEDIHNLKQKMIDERNEYILRLFDEGNTITEISKITQYSMSIVEKCVYKFRRSVEEKKNKYQEIYDKVFELKEQKLNNYQISKILKISPNTVSRYLNGENNPYNELPFKKLKGDIKQKILDLYFKDKITSNEIGKLFNISGNTVLTFINNYKYTNTEVS